MRKERVLIVEDEMNVAKDLQQKLINLGYTAPEIALTADEAIEKAILNRPDIILMDIELDGALDGIDAASKIRENEDIPIIYLIAYDDESTIERAKLTHSNGYMIKPFNLQELHSNIQLALHKNKSDIQLKQSREFLFHMIQSMGAAIIATDLNYSIQFINKNAQRLLGISEKQAIGKQITTLLNLSDVKTHRPVDAVPFLDQSTVQINNLTKLSNLLLISASGEKTIVDEILTPVMDYDSKMTGFVFIFQDMTERRNTEIVLEKINKELERRVAQMNTELFSINKKLENEINERKKTEQKVITMKESLENIINSTSEMIITLDKLNRVEYWNSAAERITGYKKKDVIGRYINKISCFENPDTLFEFITKVKDSEATYSDQISIITKDYSKKIINISCSPMHQRKEASGVLFVGKDITYDWDSHQNLIPGHSYLITQKNNTSGFDLFNNLIQNEMRGLYFSRSLAAQAGSLSHNPLIEYCTIGSKLRENRQVVSTPEELKNKIQTFVSHSSKGVILLEDIHYFITRFSFEEFINVCYEISDIVSQSQSIFLLSLTESILEEKQVAIFESEFEALPSRNVNDIKMKDELFEIIQYIYDENRKNSLVSFKKLMSKFNIVYYTASKRVEKLSGDGLVFTKKYGKSRIVHLTEKGKTLLQRRKTI